MQQKCKNCQNRKVFHCILDYNFCIKLNKSFCRNEPSSFFNCETVSKEERGNKMSMEHFGSTYHSMGFNINDLEEEIKLIGYEYRDDVRGKSSIVYEISFSECFNNLSLRKLKNIVGTVNLDSAKFLYSLAKENSGNMPIVRDIYIVEDYVDLVQKAEEYKLNGTGSNRNTIIYFKPSHCFQSMQFMRTEHGGKVIVNMRSCNLTENFLIDLALSWIVANNVFNEAYSEIDVVMNIASLHVLEPA